MRLLWLLCINSSLVVACQLDVASDYFDTLKSIRGSLQSNKKIYPFNPKGTEILESSVFMTPLLKKLKEENRQDQKDGALEVCMTSIIKWPIKRLLIAGTVFAGVDPDNKHSTMNPLIRACRAQDFELIRFLCEAGATVACADGWHPQKKILSDVQKYKIAVYLMEHGAALSNGLCNETSLLHDRTVLDADGSWRLVPLYLNKGVPVASEYENVFHRLAVYAYTYHINTITMLKKFNAIVTHLKPENILLLLETRDQSYRLLPEEMCTMKASVTRAPYELARIMKEKRELLEQTVKARPTDVPF